MYRSLWIKRLVIALCVTCVLAACSTPVAPQRALRVGVVRDYPPLMFRPNNGYEGVEADFARLLGRALGSPIRFVERGFDDLIPSLLAGEIDIMMTGMTISGERKLRIDFTDFYLKSGLAVATRADRAKEFDSLTAVLSGTQTVGVIGTTVAE